MKSSGLLFTLHPDGSANLSYEDYDVGIFNGANYEVNYILDKDNFNKFINYLDISLKIDVSAYLIKNFGKEFDSKKFERFCEEHEIIFKRNVHISQ